MPKRNQNRRDATKILKRQRKGKRGQSGDSAPFHGGAPPKDNLARSVRGRLSGKLPEVSDGPNDTGNMTVAEFFDIPTTEREIRKIKRGARRD